MDNLVCIRLFLAMLFFIQVASLTCDDGDFLDGDHCSKCPYRCQFCESKERCLSCITGYWGSACENSCSRCKDGTSCEKTTGFCLESCKPGYTGAQCDSNCNEKCSSCDRTNAQTCFSCAIGRYPPNSCDKNCPSSCYNQTCNATGFCTSGCNNGYWGQMCEKRCLGNCRGSSCFKENGTCNFGHVDIHTGSNGQGHGADSNGILVIVVVIVVAIIVIALVIGVIVYKRKRTVNNGKERTSSDKVLPDELKPLKKEEKTEAIEIEDTEASGCIKKSDGDKTVKKTEESSPVSLQSRLANGIRNCKTFICCVAAESKGADGPCNNSPVESNTGISSETRSLKSRAAKMFHTMVGHDTDRGSELLKKPEDTDATADEPQTGTSNGTKSLKTRAAKMVHTVVDRVTSRVSKVAEKPGDTDGTADKQQEEKPPETVIEVKKKTREEKLREVIDKIYAKTGEMYESEFNNLPKDMPKACTSNEKKKKHKKEEEEEILHYDKNKVVVPGKHGELCASFIKRKDEEKEAYIASKGPKKKDGHFCFWTLLWENDYKTVVMLNTIGKEEKKNEQYWPKLNKKNKYGSISVQCAKEVEKEPFITRTFTEVNYKTKKECMTKYVSQLQYKYWPERGVPDMRSLLDFLNEVKKTHPENGGPLVVHGRRGVGRTGTFIALDMLIKEVKDMADSDEEKEIDIYACVESLRNQRISMVETIEQYKFLHAALSFSISEMLEGNRGQQSEDVKERLEDNRGQQSEDVKERLEDNRGQKSENVKKRN